MNCRYYTERTLGWMLNNKLIVFLSLLCFCLFVSTLALSGQKGRLQDEVNELKNSLTTTEAPELTSEAATTETTSEGSNPDENATESVPDGTETETEPDETAPETVPDGTETETEPDESAPEAGPEDTNPVESPDENGTDQTNSNETVKTDSTQKNSEETEPGKTPAVPAKAETVELVDEDASTSDKVKEIVKGNKLLSLLA